MTKPNPPVTKPLKYWLNGQLEQADVLLARTKGPLGNQIVRFTGGSYTHTMLWDNDQCAILNATKINKNMPWKDQGVMKSSLEEIVEHKEYVDIYRYCGEDGVGLDSEQANKIVETGRKYVEDVDNFQFSGLVQCALRARGNEFLFEQGLVGRALVGIVNKWIKNSTDKKAKNGMICSEFVSMSYSDAEVPIRVKLTRSRTGDYYGLNAVERPRNLGQSGPAGLPKRERIPKNDVKREVNAMSDAFFVLDKGRHQRALGAAVEAMATRDADSTATGGASAGKREIVGVAGGDQLPFGIVSPRHFEQSPDFVLVGRIEKS